MGKKKKYKDPRTEYIKEKFGKGKKGYTGDPGGLLSKTPTPKPQISGLDFDDRKWA